MEPLSNMLKKGAKFEWGGQQELAWFNVLKNLKKR
jgi:hypothetical protein